VASSTGLSAKQLRLLGQLKRSQALRGYYLAGGSAVGWLCRHRRSVDLDLFSLDQDAALDSVVLEMTKLGARVRAESNVMVGFDTAAGPVDVVRYPYRPLKRPAAGPAGFRVASLDDLAVMKVAAIARRGIRRDFWDLYVLLKKGRRSLNAVLNEYHRRYGTSGSDTYHLARALAFFDDAERDDPRLVGLSQSEWIRIKAFFTEKSARLLTG
jgi:hypothetical protein